MAESLRINVLAQFRGKSPLRIAGNLLLAWLLCVFLLILWAFPSYPQTGVGWLLYLTMGPPVLLIGTFAIEWGSSWLKRKNPELRAWETALIVLALIWMVIWGINSIS